jgi:hypothetical protein
MRTYIQANIEVAISANESVGHLNRTQRYINCLGGMSMGSSTEEAQEY